ncbi:hypothetical protein BKA65DRAFT_535070 [Rhexocercosporidium sp. MPI-PUGE-AT-0058]|nr:hypothetical protein BKA65DRAFT_535070 [Rhexocercosporidium sp. MPI-PUGE-AT-0058]
MVVYQLPLILILVLYLTRSFVTTTEITRQMDVFEEEEKGDVEPRTENVRLRVEMRGFGREVVFWSRGMGNVIEFRGGGGWRLEVGEGWGRRIWEEENGEERRKDEYGNLILGEPFTRMW